MILIADDSAITFNNKTEKISFELDEYEIKSIKTSIASSTVCKTSSFESGYTIPSSTFISSFDDQDLEIL